MKFRKFFSACMFLFVISDYAFAQMDDAGLWASVTVKKKITKKFTLSLSEECRFNENVSELGTAFTEAGVEYKLIKNLTGGIAYRFMQKKQVDDFYSLRHRGLVSLTYKLKVKKFELNLKERYQIQYADVNTSEDGKIPSEYLRNKLTIKYNTSKKYTPFIAAELFYQLNNPEGNECDDIRYSGGIEYNFNKLHEVDLFYLI